jgi:hypothetical protein
VSGGAVAPFPTGVRIAALLWLALFVGAYWRTYGAANFLHLCDVAVILTCWGLWRGSALLLSSQAVSSLVVDVAWDLDLAWRFVTGGHIVGGTEYMWDARFPLAVRLMSFFHVAWPPLLVWALRRVGYDRRALLVQSLIGQHQLRPPRPLPGPLLGPGPGAPRPHLAGAGGCDLLADPSAVDAVLQPVKPHMKRPSTSTFTCTST